uniref:Sulfotransferase n=1 Tax=Callorhinchus milii TaxID=7868 RepID=V9KQ59_CALMI
MSEKATCQRFQYKGCNFLSPIYTIEHLEKLEHFEVRDSDVFAVTYPKSGTMWMQQILSLIYSDDDTPAVQSKSAMERVPWIELPNSNFEVRQSPRLSVTHLPYHLVPKGLKDKQGKVIYVARNPRDVLMSLYYLHNHLSTFETPKSFQDFMEQFVDGRVEFSSWFDHVREWYNHRDEFNFMYITYEEMKKDLRASILKICSFLGKHLDNEKLNTVLELCTFNTMKVNPMANYEKVPKKSNDGAFLRKGTIGDWKTHFTVAQSEMFDRIFQEKMKDFPLSFVWDQE